MKANPIVPLGMAVSMVLLAAACQKPVSQTAADTTATAAAAPANAADPGGAVSPPQPNGAVNTDANKTTADATPASNSFTEGQAKGHIENAGFTDVADLQKTKDGLWTATAKKDGKSVVAAGWLVSTAVGAVVGAAAGGATGGLLGALKDAGHTDQEAHVFAEGVRRGGTLVSVRCESGDHRATAERVLNGVGGVDAVTRGDQYRAAGWQSFEASAEPYSADQVRAERGGRFPEDRSFTNPDATSLGQSDDLRTEPVRDGGFADPAARPTDPTERSGV